MRTKCQAMVAGVGVLAVVLVLGCAKGSSKEQRFGTVVPKGAATAKLGEILEKPAAYAGREVVLEGTYAGHCCATDFNYKEGVDAVEVYYPGFDVPEQKAGRPVRIYATVRVKGVGANEGAEEKPDATGEAAEEAHVALDAKGVEFR